MKKNKELTRARKYVMYLLAKRDYSEKELRERLERNDKYQQETVEQVIEDAWKNKWLLPPEELAQKVARHLHEKLKGHLYIVQYLRKKGLPAVEMDEELEADKASEIVARKYKNQTEDFKDRVKIQRFLASRGFLSPTIQQVLRNSN